MANGKSINTCVLCLKKIGVKLCNIQVCINRAYEVFLLAVSVMQKRNIIGG